MTKAFLNYQSPNPGANPYPAIGRTSCQRQSPTRCRVAARQAQKEWKPPANRADPVDLLIENSKGRVEDLLPIRYGRMLVSPFTFYRGAAAVMAYDLSHTPATGLTLLADGDCHLLNFSGFATTERKPIFDINDFDERYRSLPGNGTLNA